MSPLGSLGNLTHTGNNDGGTSADMGTSVKKTGEVSPNTGAVLESPNVAPAIYEYLDYTKGPCAPVLKHYTKAHGINGMSLVSDDTGTPNGKPEMEEALPLGNEVGFSPAILPYILYDVRESRGHKTDRSDGRKTLTVIDSGETIEEAPLVASGLDSATSELNYDATTSENGFHLHLSKKRTSGKKGYSLNDVRVSIVERSASGGIMRTHSGYPSCENNTLVSVH